MRKSDYICKTEDFLNSTDFDTTPKDLTPGFLKKVNSTIKQNKDILQLFNFRIDWLTSSVPVTPLLYSLPKIHKPGIPVRPIVSFVGTPAHGLSSFLCDVFQRHLDNRSEFSIKNSSELVHQIKDLKFPEGATMVSFDIVNLYPSTPPVEAAELINQLLAFSDLSDDVVSSLSALLKVCLEQNIFKFNNRFYIQKNGLSMGSPLAPLLAECFLKYLENKLKDTNLFKKHILFWRRYVDDIFCIFLGDQSDLDMFLDFINTLHPRITFTVEAQTNGTLPFLDLLLRSRDDKIEFSIYRKPTTTDHVIPFSSNHPLQYKLTAFRSFFYRLLTTPLSAEDYETEYNIILQIAHNNGFPMNLVQNTFRRISHKIMIRHNTHLTPISDENIIFKSIPYVPGVSERIQKYLKKFNIQISFKVENSLRAILSRGKDKVDPVERMGVYRLECSCGSFYIGRSFRSIRTRIDEHFRAIRTNNPNKSTFAEHILSNSGHVPSLEPCILSLPQNRSLCDSLEKIHITKAKHNTPTKLLNTQQEFPELLICPHLLGLLPSR
ncbi:uncharacterized protein LOC123313085 [Coccinella septempunctata]|uniref:uncharacterized protein LOC123313085 n=1 Tax=Coccinella septempunctata TaxID=41139 RepID=UPI001D06D637|nr:uncharacterized protein LOC123313085 [Coccinella septempunctata]